MQVDGWGPDARFTAPNSLALVAGELYVTDDTTLRKVTGHTGWYPATKAVFLQPVTDDLGFWAFTEGNFRPGPTRLSVALYAPAEAVGLQVDGIQVGAAHHPLYTLRWDAQPGPHRLTPLIRWPDGSWDEGASWETQAIPAGANTERSNLFSPRPRSWVSGTVDLQAISYWQEATLAVDGKVVAQGSGPLVFAWDTTQVSDGFHEISLTVDATIRDHFQVYVGNAGFPPQEPDGGWVAYFFGQQYIYTGTALPKAIGFDPLLPFHETALALGFQTAWDPKTQLLSASRGEQNATIDVNTRETTGLRSPLTASQVVQEGEEFLVDWQFFILLTQAQAMLDTANQTLVFRQQ